MTAGAPAGAVWSRAEQNTTPSLHEPTYHREQRSRMVSATLVRSSSLPSPCRARELETTMEGGRLVRPRNLEFVLLPGFESRLEESRRTAEAISKGTLHNTNGKKRIVKKKRDKTATVRSSYQKLLNHDAACGPRPEGTHKKGNKDAMTTKRKRTEVPLRKPQFFKILLSGFSQTLTIPPPFNQYIVGEIQEEATIVSPLGKSWPVRVHKADECSFYFREGWQEFSQAHELNVGYFLLFRYEGEMVFNVTVFDRTTCRKEYSFANEMGADLHSHVGVMPPESQNRSDYECFQGPSTSLCGKMVDEAMEPTTNKRQGVGMGDHVACSGDGEKPDVVNGSVRRPHFEVTINLLKHNCKYRLAIPAKFAASNGFSSINQLILIDPNGHLWPMRVTHVGRSPKVHAGWRGFFVGNNLQDGDVCSFELKAKNELLVKIHRRRCLESMKSLKDVSWNPKKRPICGQTAAELVKTEVYHRVGRARTIQDRKVYESANTRIPGPQFTCTMFPSNIVIKACLNIPSSFLSSVDLSSMRRITLVDPEARGWPVNLYQWMVKTKRKVQIGLGWRAFCTHNNVEVGDKCTFKLASREEKDVFHVNIIKHKGTPGFCRTGH